MVVEVKPAVMLRVLEDALGFLEDEARFRLVDRSADQIGSLVSYSRGHTLLTVSWDARENALGAEFNPFDPATSQAQPMTRVLIEELVAIGGGRATECVQLPDRLTPHLAEEAAFELALLIRRYGGGLLEDDWGDTVDRVAAWTRSGAWRDWRDG